jgi:hypothetical protein
MISTLSPFNPSMMTDVMTFSIFIFTIACLIILLSLKILIKSELQRNSVKRFQDGINVLLPPFQIIFILFVIERVATLL